MPRDEGVGMRRRATVKGKRGAIVREGCETDTPVVATLPHGSTLQIADTKKSSKGVARARIVADGIEGWASARTLRADPVAEVWIRHCPGGSAG